MRHVIAAGIAAAAILTSSPAADAAGRHHLPGCNSARCDRAARAACSRHAACRHRVEHKRRVRLVNAWRWWLGPTGACESGTDNNLHHGLRAISPGGTYRGRYQFDYASWAGAGGYGDPVNADWLEQAYRAVRWRIAAGNGAWPVCGAG